MATGRLIIINLVVASVFAAVAQGASAAEHTVAVQVVDSTGTRVQNILVHQVTRRRNIDTPAALESNDGLYDVPRSCWIAAPGTSWQFLQSPATVSGDDPLPVILTAESTLTFRAVDQAGQPLSILDVTQLFPDGIQWNSHNIRAGLGAPGGQLIIRTLPPGWYAFRISAGTDEQTHSTRAFAFLEPGVPLTKTVRFGPPQEGSGEYHLETLLTRRTPLSELWEELTSDARKELSDAALDLAAQLPGFIHYQDQVLYRLFALSRETAALPHLARIYQQTPNPFADDPIRRDFPFVIAELGGNEAIPYLMEAARNPDISHKRRSLAVIAINRIGTDESLAAWRELSAPYVQQKRPANFTHADGMKQALDITLNAIPQSKVEHIIKTDSAAIEEDYRTGRMSVTTERGLAIDGYILHRYGEEWLVVDIDFELRV